MVAAAREQRPSAQGLKEFKAALAVLLPALHGLSQRETADLLQLRVSRVGSLPAEARHPCQVYRRLARHGWRKVAPDSTHPKTDEAGQEAWKKTPESGGLPSSIHCRSRQNASIDVSG